MNLTNKTYDYVKIGVTVVLPAVGACYGAVAQTWGLPYTEQIVTTIAAITACGSAILNGISKNYHNQED